MERTDRIGLFGNFKSDELLPKLELLEANTESVIVDLDKTAFVKEGEFGKLESDGRTFILKDWSSRQLFRMLKIPYSFLERASADLNNRLVGEFIPSLKDDDRKVQVKIRGKGSKVVEARGIVGVDYSSLSNLEIVSSFLGALKSGGYKFTVPQAGFMTSDKDIPVNLLRVVLEEARLSVGDITYDGVRQKDDIFLGVDMTFSDIGGCPLEMCVSLMRLVCENGMVTRIGKGPYFFFDYKGECKRPVEIVCSSSVSFAAANSGVFLEKVKESAAKKLDPAQVKTLLALLQVDPRIGKGVVLKTAAQFQTRPPENEWEVANGLTAAAKSYRDALRVRYEKVAGELVGLTLTRPEAEELDMISESFGKPVPSVRSILNQ